MNIALMPGTYVVAVSGGVDSMALLHALSQRPGLKLIVAHFDHGIREDSAQDRKLVENTAKQLKLPFVYHQGNLGPGASEATARTARYDFLHGVKNASKAHSVITAHHQDDLLETALLNMLRGTGRRGLTSLKSTDGIIRPLLKYPKDHIKDYAQRYSLAWREDSTNSDIRYRRNYVRHKLLSQLTSGQRAQFIILLEQLAQVNQQLDIELINLLHTQPGVSVLDRDWFIALPHDLSQEILHHWLTRHGIVNLQRRRIEQLVVALKTAQPKTVHEVSKKHKISVHKNEVELLVEPTSK